MPRYFFDVKNGHRLVHPAGLECRDDQEAIAKATVIAQPIARESEASEGRHGSVINGNGDEVGKVRPSALTPVHNIKLIETRRDYALPVRASG
jgi:hypothetical protein